MLAFIAILPPFEGFDEPAHLSYIERVAWTGTWPRHGDPTSAEVDAYLAEAPVAGPMHGPWTYASFFASGPDALAGGRAAAKGVAARAGAFEPGAIPNWEAQHPPLYYGLLAPLARTMSGWPLADRLLVLRVASYTIACAGLLLGCLAAWRLSRRLRDPDATAVRLAPVLWPVMLPMWFPDMARLGNDSLVVLIAGAVACIVCRDPEGAGSRGGAVLLGSFLGLGLLTKATFLPLTAAAVLLTAWEVRSAADWRARAERGVRLGLCCLAIGGIAGWWYVGRAWATGSLIGSNDGAAVEAGGGLLRMLAEHGSVAAFLRIPYSYVTSMVWAGSWSAVVPPLALDLPLFAGTLAIVAAAAWRTARRRRGSVDALAIGTLALFLAGLTVQSVDLIAVNGQPAPAWYLQSFLPILAVLLVGGIVAAARYRVPFAAFLAYAVLFLVVATAVQAVHFAGCGSTPPDSHQISWSSATACLSAPGPLLDRLGAIAFPGLGIALAFSALLCLVSGLVLAQACAARASRTGSASTRRSG